MYPISNLRQWRIVNSVLIIIGLMTPWFDIKFDVQPIPPDLAIGWEFIGAAGFQAVDRLRKFGFEILMFPFILIGVSGILLFLYFIFNFLAIITERNFKIYKMIPVALIGIVVALSFPLLFMRPLLGYWVFILALLSCAVLEWKRMKETGGLGDK